jgi:hypothetical protein
MNTSNEHAAKYPVWFILDGPAEAAQNVLVSQG